MAAGSDRLRIRLLVYSPLHTARKHDGDHLRPMLNDMQYICSLPDALKRKASSFEKFANGGSQATAVLKDGRIIGGLLVSNSSAVVAALGHTQPPFAMTEITDLYQTDEDKHPQERGGWHCWDDWAQRVT